jgi:hypothetical protein
MATIGETAEKADALEIQADKSKPHAEHHQNEHHSRHFKEINVPPIEDEAVTDAEHVKLGWRSWVGAHVFHDLDNGTPAYQTDRLNSSSCSLHASRTSATLGKLSMAGLTWQL